MDLNMEDDRAKTRPNSSESTTESPETVGSTPNRYVDASPDRDPDGGSPSETGCAQREFRTMAPEEKLKHFDRRSQASEDNQEFDTCIQDLVRCVALTRLVYGERHLKLAQAHARLAKAYFQFKGWGLQAQEHSALARELLPFSILSCRGEKPEVLLCLLSLDLTQGGASLLTDNLVEAESSFVEAEQVLEQLHQNNGINQEERIKTQLEIFAGLCRVYKRQNRPEEALGQCEKSLQLLNDCNKREKTCAVYRDMATIEQDRGHLDRAVEHLSQAHAIAMSHRPEELEGAQIAHSLALILSAAAEPHHNDSADQFFEQSLSAYRSSVGPQDPAFLSAQDDYCRFLLRNGQQEKCAEIQRASLDSKRSAFGDLSTEVADTLELIGSVEMSKGKLNQAHRTMTECLKIQTLLYGPKHKTTKAVQKAVNMLARVPEVAERLQRQSRRKTKLHTSALEASSANNESCTSDS
ncbi:tetratricopeptide repeat protein 23 [Parambassis ranga]|uniref:Tetratricopeptide repeat protein 23 n=1 Tax=Parambassis ranga TaxID=210632 RepID=A0A6P7KAF2_9TELE|nr:tetratricopeptide repeat protein 23-like [Parambassis ranga]